MSPTPTYITSNFIMSAKLQIEGQQVGLILHLEQEKTKEWTRNWNKMCPNLFTKVQE